MERKGKKYEEFKQEILKHLPCYKINLLIKYDLLEKYIFNFIHYGIDYPLDYRFNAIKDKDEFIDYSFYWQMTKEGLRFWSSYNSDFINWARSRRKKNANKRN